jgi:hypothetical protein
VAESLDRKYDFEPDFDENHIRSWKYDFGRTKDLGSLTVAESLDQKYDF